MRVERGEASLEFAVREAFMGADAGENPENRAVHSSSNRTNVNHSDTQGHFSLPMKSRTNSWGL